MVCHTNSCYYYRKLKTTRVDMQLTITKASDGEKDVIRNLMQFYIYDFSEFIELDVEEDGLFEPYQPLESYWTEPDHRFPWLVKAGDKYAGFVLVRLIETTGDSYFSIAEFFILKKYRRQRMGTEVAEKIFDQYRGKWQVYQKESNRPAQQFWRSVIDGYTNGMFEEKLSEERATQYFDNSIF